MSNKKTAGKNSRSFQYSASFTCPETERPEPGYDFDQAKSRLRDGFEAIIKAAAGLPAETLFNDYLALEMVRRPDRLAEANYPRHLLKYLKLVAIGHSLSEDEPSWPSGVDPAGKFSAPVIILATRRHYLAHLDAKLDQLWPKSRAAYEMTCLKQIKPITVQSRLKKMQLTPNQDGRPKANFITALYPTPQGPGFFPQKAFHEYAAALGFEADYIQNTKGLNILKIKVRGEGAALPALAEFTFIREILPG